MTTVLMVCLGNICRSPLAEGILAERGRGRLSVDSAGTGAYHVGEAPDRRSVAVARRNGIDISGQRARQFEVGDFEAFDHIFAMDRQNLRDIRAMAPNEGALAKVRLLLPEAGQAVEEVPDPYYGGADGFDRVFEMLDAACSALIEKNDW